MIIMLDAGPLGLVTNPRANSESTACNVWMEKMILKGHQIAIPEIADYEVRRELLRANKINGLRNLDLLAQAPAVLYVSITTPAMRRAAEYWAQVRQRGQPTADNRVLDGDVILAAQANLLGEQGNSVVIATTNVGHLARLANAQHWQDITGR